MINIEKKVEKSGRRNKTARHVRILSKFVE